MYYRVVSVSKTGDLIDFPDNDEFPHLIKHIRDEEELFIVNKNTKEYWPAIEFFMMVNIKHFIVPKTPDIKRSIINKGVAKAVFFDGGGLSCGNASSYDEAVDVAWEKLPDDIKKQITKEDLKPIELGSSWVV